jgi:hypothetical protein
LHEVPLHSAWMEGFILIIGVQTIPGGEEKGGVALGLLVVLLQHAAGGGVSTASDCGTNSKDEGIVEGCGDWGMHGVR